MVRFHVVLIAVLGACGCGKKDEPATAATPAPGSAPAAPAPAPAAPPTTPPPVPAPGPDVTPPPAIAPPAPSPAPDGQVSWRTIAVTALPAAAKVEGRAERVITWTDTLGDNHAVFSSRDGERADTRWRAVWVRHWATRDGATRLVREVKEHSGECAFDVTTEFVDPALGVTDLDGDGLAELTFAYRVGCRSDVSPLTLKLLVLEGGDKYILRGETVIDAGDARYGGTKKLDPSLVNGPPAFRRHAEAVWARSVAE